VPLTHRPKPAIYLARYRLPLRRTVPIGCKSVVNDDRLYDVIGVLV
jgi:hypothetical protein